MKLETCSTCRGFLPSTADHCPHCRTKRIGLGAIATVLGSGAIAFTLMACYGAAPCAEGGNCHPTTPSPDLSAVPAKPAAPDAGK